MLHQEAFDNKWHDLLIPILQEIDISEKDTQIIHELYWNQTAKFKLNHTSQTSNIRIAKDTYLPFLFNIYMEKIFQLALKGHTTAVKVNGMPINNLCGRYGDTN